MTSLEPEEVDELLFSWRFHARKNQLPPAGDWFVWLIRSGRGYGKTWVGSNYVIERAQQYPDFPIALVGQTKSDVRDTMIELGGSSIIQQSPPWFEPKYEPSKRRVTWPNGCVGIAYSGDEPGQLRGPQHGTAWVDELAKFKYPEETMDNLELGVRLGIDPRIIATTTPRAIKVIKELLNDPDTVDVRGSTYENFANLSQRFIDRIRRKYEGTRLARQELHGEVLLDTPGALWTQDIIDTFRVKSIDLINLKRIVVAIDPAVTAHEESDETGIIVAGMAYNDHLYVHDDISLKGSPDQWARASVNGYYRYQADRIVGETNNGGDMVEHTIRTVDRQVAFKQVRASRGKYTRAEPVAALYEQGKVHHIGMFAELEDQMCTWVPGDASPDRMDALVWAITELAFGKQNEVYNIL